MSDMKRWSEPDWEWLPEVGYDESPFGSRAVATGILLGAGALVGLVAALWNFFG